MHASAVSLGLPNRPYVTQEGAIHNNESIKDSVYVAVPLITRGRH